MARSGLVEDLDVQVRVDRLGPTATGLAHPTDSRSGTLEVGGVLAGEVARVRVEHVGRRRAYGRLLEVVKPAPDRVEARCSHFLRCGGCQLLHASGAHQRRLKRGWVAERLGLDRRRVDAVVPAPRDFGYRAFAKLVVGPGGILGSYRPRSHDVESMDGCRIHAPAIERVADAMRARFGRDGVPAGLRYVLVRASMAEGAGLVTLVTAAEAAPGLEAVVELLGQLDVVRAVSQHVNPSEGDALWGGGPTRLLLKKGPLVERVGPIVQDLLEGAFSQVNPEAAALLYGHVASALHGARRVADLYAGSGGVAQTLLHEGVARVVAVEATPAAAAALDAAAERWRAGERDRLEVRHGPVEDHLEVLRHVDAAVVNPPRKGLGPEVTAAFAAHGPERVVYVSCEPKTLARDLEALSAAYAIERVTPFDLFPQTRHVETVVTATRSS